MTPRAENQEDWAEENWAIETLEASQNRVTLENETGRVVVPRSWLPHGVRQGDWLTVRAQNGVLRITPNPEKTNAAKTEIAALRAALEAQSEDDGGNRSV